MQFTQNTLYIVTEFIISLNGRDQINIHTYLYNIICIHTYIIQRFTNIHTLITKAFSKNK